MWMEQESHNCSGEQQEICLYLRLKAGLLSYHGYESDSVSFLVPEPNTHRRANVFIAQVAFRLACTTFALFLIVTSAAKLYTSSLLFQYNFGHSSNNN